jgi:MYXO-CTERM domain-containing protein
MRSIFLLLLLSPSAWAVIFYSTADPAHNRETAPGGALAGSGWQYQGLFGSYLGTAISPNHLGVASSTFVSKDYFNGASDITYAINTTVNSGLGYWNIAGTDLRVFQITGTFSSYAPLYTAGDEVGNDLVVMGRGTQRGTTVTLGVNDIGWRWGSADLKARWGTNQVAAAVSLSGADCLYATFDADVGGDEAHLSVGDSGGAVFINDGGVWKLAGINYSVDGNWDYNAVVDAYEFRAALFDARGMYVGTDGTGPNPIPNWTLVEDDGVPVPSGFYSTRISSYKNQIYGITGVPEPGALTLVALAGLFALRRSRRH